MRFRMALAAGIALIVGSAAPGAAQESARAALLARATAAYDDFDLPRAARFARQAVDPALGPRDTVWARGVHLLTQLLLETDQAAHAQLWARWALRLSPAMPLDSSRFLARVVGTLRAARDSGGSSPSDAAVRETYVWPAAATATARSARFRLGSSPAPVRVLVRGVGVLAAGDGVSLEPGRYEMEVTADGFLPLRVTREALPGVTTEFAFLPLPATAAAAELRPDVRSRVRTGLVTLNVQRFGLPLRCAVGAVVGDDGRIATAYDAIRGADSVWLADNGTRLRIAAWDRSANLALLTASGVSAPALDPAPLPMPGQALFGFGSPRCNTMQEARALVDDGPSSRVTLTAPAATLEAGAAMFDFEGRLVGFADGGRGVGTPAALAALEQVAAANTGAARTARDVAEAEGQRFGVVTLRSALRGASIRVEPMETWHWATLDTTAAAPLTFAGPAGRYRVHLLVSGASPQTDVVTVVPGTRSRVTVGTRAATTADASSAQGARRRVPRWAWYVAAGAGVAAAVILGGNGGGEPAPSVVISVPNP